jgi:predicted phosphodiesterase
MSTISRREALKYGAAFACLPVLGSTSLSSPVGAAEPVKKPKVDPYIDAKFVDGEPQKPAAGSFTIAVLPDTQHYSEKYPAQYLAQTDWIVENLKARNIACVLHLGDITNHNAPAEWEVAVKAMSRLDEHVPYFMAVGNHDYSEKGTCADRTTLYNEYFPIDKFRGRKTFGGAYDREPQRMENSYHLFSAGGRDFIVFTLEFGPRADVVRWANEIAAQHKTRAAILVTHAYMFNDDTRYDWAKYGKVQTWNPHNYKVAMTTADDINDGEQLWSKLVGKQENFILTLNGHVLGDGLARLSTPTAAGRDVHQVLVNFQMKPQGGDGWLRLLEFRADGRTVEAFDYSPTRNQCNVSPQNRFTMRIAPPV